MPEHHPLIGRRLVVALGACLAILCALPGLAASAAKAAPLNGWLGNGTKFPDRALVVVPPAGTKVSSATVHVTENGTPVTGLSVIPTTNAVPGDFGLMVVADQSTGMKAGSLSAVLSATRSLVSLRSAGQEFGVIGFSQRPSLLAPLSADTTAIQKALSAPPAAGKGTNVPGAIQLALRTLDGAHVALGAIVVVSNGVGDLAPGSPTPTSVANAAAAAHVPIFTVGLQDKASSAGSLAALRKAAPGQFLQSPPSHLPAMLKAIDGIVTHGYVVRWRSALHAGQTANVAARVDGTPGSLALSYQAPAAPAAAAPAHAPASKPLSVPTTPAGQLSPTPGFAVAHPTTPASAAAAPSSAAAAPVSFWSSAAATPVIAALVGLLVAIAVALALYRPSQRAVRVRVGSYVPVIAEQDEDPLGLSQAPSKSIVHRLESSDRWKAYALDVDVAQSKHTPIDLVKRSAGIGLVLTVLVALISGSTLLGFVPLLGWPIALRKLTARNALKNREKFRETLPGYLQDLASAMRVGRSFIGAMTVVAESAEEPTKTELSAVIADESLGLPLEEALEAVAKRMEAPDLDQIALIAALNRRSGSNVAEALDRVSEGARERADLKREVNALTAQAKMSSWVLTALPGVLLVGLMLVSPVYAHPLFHTTMGIVLLGVGATMCYAGWKAMKKITDVKV
ncbi:MAG TPA: type II secretion system F family protein [Solirubrobacteraceae bacterium]